jgi:hypothetical protein
MQDKPTAAELLEAIAAFISEEALPALSGAERFHGLVAANVARILAREAELAPAALEQECAELGRLLERSGEPTTGTAGYELALELNRELCRRIEAGEADAEPFRSRVLAYLERSVAAKLAIDNPRFK